MIERLNRLIIFPIAFLIALLLNSCESKLNFSDEDHLRAFLVEEDNGLIKTRQHMGYRFEVSYVPPDMLVNLDVKSLHNKNPDIDSLRKKYSRHYYFQLSMTRNGDAIDRNLQGGISQYRVLKNKLIYGLYDQIFMSTKNSDSIGITDYIYPRLYGLNHSTNILFFFNKEEVLADDKILVVNLKDVGINNRKLKFQFNLEKIQRNMEIDFNKN